MKNLAYTQSGQDIVDAKQKLADEIANQQSFLARLIQTPAQKRTPAQTKFINSSTRSIEILQSVQALLTDMVEFHFGSGFYDMANTIALQQQTINVLKDEVKHLRAGEQSSEAKEWAKYRDAGILFKKAMYNLKEMQYELERNKRRN